MKDFKLIVISSPIEVEEEFDILNSLLQKGVPIFHLRKPGMALAEFENCITAIKQEFHDRIVIHSNYDLFEKYKLKGIHFTSDFLKKNAAVKIKETATKVKQAGGTVSTSVHSFEEIETVKDYIDYVFLSPVFNSISKPDYHSKIDLVQAKIFFKSYNKKARVVALGGISDDNINLIKDAGFHGAALLGAIWS